MLPPLGVIVKTLQLLSVSFWTELFSLNTAGRVLLNTTRKANNTLLRSSGTLLCYFKSDYGLFSQTTAGGNSAIPNGIREGKELGLECFYNFSRSN